MIVFGGADGFDVRNDVWAMTLDGGTNWEKLKPIGIPPRERGAFVGVYDPIRMRIIIFGGSSGELPENTLGDLWELNFAGSPRWKQLDARRSGPSPRFGAKGIYDPTQDRVLIFGGMLADRSRTNEVWELSLRGVETWRLLEPTGSGPGARWGHSAIHDPVNQRMVIFGGSGSGGIHLNDVFALSLSGPPSWSRLEPSSPLPSPFMWHSAIYEPTARCMLVYGGFQQNGDQSSDVWSLQLDSAPSWQRLVVSGAPRGAVGHSAILDAPRRRMLAFGGSRLQSEVWQFALETAQWSRISPAFGRPRGRARGVAFYDAHRDLVFIYGSLYFYAGQFVEYGSPWSLTLQPDPIWKPLAFPGDPELSVDGNWVYDPAGDRLLIIGDRAGLDTIWELSLSSERWSALRATGPTPRRGSPMITVFDQTRRRAFIFGLGESWRETWTLEMGEELRWRQLLPENPPPWQIRPTAVLDPVRDRLLMFGGTTAGLVQTSTVWSLDFANESEWRMLTTSGSGPSQRSSACGFYDPQADRLIIFGGGSGGGPLDDLWQLSLGELPVWTQLFPSGTSPVGRYSASAVHDLPRERMVLIGGSAGFDLEDTWFLDWDRSPRPVDRSANSERPNRGAVVGREAMTRDGLLGDGSPAGASSILRVVPNPVAAIDARVKFTLPTRSQVQLTVWDLSGRSVRSLIRRTLDPGDHDIPWNGLDGSGRALPNGIYVLDLKYGGHRIVTKVAITR